MQIFKSLKAQLILYLVFFAFFLAAKDKNTAFLITLALSVLFCVIIESGALYLKNRSFKVTESSMITGLIIGYVLSSDQSWAKFLAACLLAILSKHLIRFDKKHIFNPAALGIFLCLIFLGAWAGWQGTYLWYVLVPGGIYFAHKTRKLPLLAGYFLASFILFGLQAVFQGVPLSKIAGIFSYFYIFIMVVEPRTTPAKPQAQLFFGSGVALLIFIFTECAVKFDAELASLLIMNLAATLGRGLIIRKVK